MQKTHQISEVVPGLPRHEPAWESEASDELYVGLKLRRIGAEDYVDERRKELVGACRRILWQTERLKDVSAALHYAL